MKLVLCCIGIAAHLGRLEDPVWREGKVLKEDEAGVEVEVALEPNDAKVVDVDGNYLVSDSEARRGRIVRSMKPGDGVGCFQAIPEGVADDGSQDPARARRRPQRPRAARRHPAG